MKIKRLENNNRKRYILIFSLFVAFCFVFATAGVSYAFLTGKFEKETTSSNPESVVTTYYNTTEAITETSIELVVNNGTVTLKVNGTTKQSQSLSSSATSIAFDFPISIKNTGVVISKIKLISITTSSDNESESTVGFGFGPDLSFTVADSTNYEINVMNEFALTSGEDFLIELAVGETFSAISTLNVSNSIADGTYTIAILSEIDQNK